MNVKGNLARYLRNIYRPLEQFTPLFDLSVRLWIAWIFFHSGLAKLGDWENTQLLFRQQYQVPLLPPEVAAYLCTGAELLFPILLAAGLAGRISALALFLFNIAAVACYASFLFSAQGAIDLQQHILWGALLLITLFHGPGKISIDHVISRRLFYGERRIFT
jgi:putative oxidoreductase